MAKSNSGSENNVLPTQNEINASTDNPAVGGDLPKDEGTSMSSDLQELETSQTGEGADASEGTEVTEPSTPDSEVEALTNPVPDAENAAPTEDSLEGGTASGGVTVTLVDGHAGSDQQDINPETGDHVGDPITFGTGKKAMTPEDKLAAARELIAIHPMAGGVEGQVTDLLSSAGHELGLAGFAEVREALASDMKRVRGIWDAGELVFKDILGNTCLTITKAMLFIQREIDHLNALEKPITTPLPSRK